MANLNNLTTIQPGEVRNPKGRPKGSQNRGAQIKRILAMKSEEMNPITREKERLTQEQWCIIGMIGAARKGNTRAFEILMDGKYSPILHLLNPNGEGHDIPDLNERPGFITFEIVDPKFDDQVTILEISANQ